MADKEIILVRGLPGAGKTTAAYNLTNTVFEADDYFYILTGQYKYNASEIGKAHGHCQERTELAMQKGISPIAVANTFCCKWEMIHYHNLAKQYGYSVREITIDYGHSVEWLAENNLHCVPLEKIQQMKDRWEV